jgi:hypothetical protein
MSVCVRYLCNPGSTDEAVETAVEKGVFCSDETLDTRLLPPFGPPGVLFPNPPLKRAKSPPPPLPPELEIRVEVSSVEATSTDNDDDDNDESDPLTSPGISSGTVFITILRKNVSLERKIGAFESIDGVRVIHCA